MQNKKMLNEITVAGAIGGAIGVVIAMALISEYGFSPLATLILSGISCAGISVISYRPMEVGSILRLVGARFGRDISQTLTAVASGAASHSIRISLTRVAKNSARRIKSVLVVVFLATLLIVSAGLTLGWLVKLITPGDTPAAKDVGVFVTYCLMPLLSTLLCTVVSATLFVVLFLADNNGWGPKTSWWLPLIMRLRVAFRGDDGPVDVWMIKMWKTRRMVFLSLIMLAIPPAMPIALAIMVLMLAIDVTITIILALASTERLAAMCGGLLGTITGTICYLNGLTPVYVVAIGGILGGFSGRWLYVLRNALAPKPRTA